MTANKVALKNMTEEELKEFLKSIGEKPFRGSQIFSWIYKSGDYYILRDMVNGIRLDDYIKENGLSQQLIYNLYRLINEFKSLKFTKLDARCRDIYVNKNERLMVIDPKQCYRRKVDYPRHLMKGLDGIDVLEEFLRGIYIIDKRRGSEWEYKINQYYAKEY